MLTPTERKVSCVTSSAHVVWMCNGKLVAVGDHPVYQTCMEDDQLVLEVLIRFFVVYSSVSQPPGRGPVSGPGINYTGP